MKTWVMLSDWGEEVIAVRINAASLSQGCVGSLLGTGTGTRQDKGRNFLPKWTLQIVNKADK
jgi:hypothetical protein